MKRLLYVRGGGVSSVRKDGLALVVQVEGEADRRYPFRYLSRIVLRGDTRIHAAAIWGLLSAGIPISLLSSDGEPCGFALPFRPARDAPADWVECLLEGPEGKDRWSCWLASRERREVRRVFRLMEWHSTDWRIPQIEKRLMDRSNSETLAALAGRRDHLSSELVLRLSEAGIPPGYLVLLEKQMAWTTRLTRLLCWEPWALAIKADDRELPLPSRWERDKETECARTQVWVAEILRWLEGSVWRDWNGRHGW